MGAAFGWGLVSASSLVIGSLIAIWLNLSLRTIGLIMGFGAGVLISAVAFDLVEEAAAKSSGHGVAVWGLFAGCGVFFGGDWLISRLGVVTASMPTAPRRAALRWRSCSGPCWTVSRSRW